MVAIDQQVWQSSGRGSAWLLSNKATRSSSTAWWNAFLKKRGNQIGAVSFTMMMMMMVVTLSCRNQHHVTVRRFSSIPKETPSSRQKPQRGHTVEDLLHKHDHSMRTVAGDYTGDSKHLAPVLQGGKETAASRSFNELKTVVSSSKQVAMTTPLPSAEQASQLPSLQSPPTVPVVLNSTTIPTKKPRQVVIVFGVCLSKIAQRQAQRSEFGTNSGQHQHSKKPYDVAAILATRLWIQQYPSLKVVVLLATKTTATLRSHSLGVPSPLEEETIRMSKLVRAAGGIPWVVNTDYSSNPERACVRAAQLGRAFLYESGLVEDDDIIVTSDSDAFPINATARLAPLRQLMDSDSDEARVWISNYGHALRNKKTIPFCFIGQSASDWRLSWQMTPHNLTFRDAVERSVAAGNSTTTKQSRSAWGMDQTLVTASIMNRGLCTFPKSHGLWTQLRVWITPNQALQTNDTLTCVKQDDIGKQCLMVYDRNKNKQCQWVHFRPTVTQAELETVYKSIASGYPNFIPAARLLSIEALNNTDISTPAVSNLAS